MYRYTEWKAHPYTDIMVLRERFGFECLNFGAGYYNYHTDNEYVVIEDVENAIRVGKNVIDSLGTNSYKVEVEKEYLYEDEDYYELGVYQG